MLRQECERLESLDYDVELTEEYITGNDEKIDRKL